MIQDYRLLGYNLPHNLEETVQNYIKQGYQPYGSPFVDGDHYYQAMVKYGTEEISTAEYVHAWNEEAKHHLNVPILKEEPNA